MWDHISTVEKVGGEGVGVKLIGKAFYSGRVQVPPPEKTRKSNDLVIPCQLIQTFWIANQKWPEVQEFCSIDDFVPTTRAEVQTNFPFYSDQTSISMAHTYLVSNSSNYTWTWDIVLTRFSDCFLCWPQMMFDLHEKQ